ncbi:hypothetical protein ACIQVO_39215 [Streptomyces sp. NPDC101062]|uniref:hypothetical protein n=1 Tax=unclassified Streptomyces TaxID=2593676 RepID=UPI0037FA74AA
MSFTLESWETQQGHRSTHQYGWRGTSEVFGEIVVTYPVARRSTWARIGVDGERIPASSFEGFADGSRPSLSLMEFRVGTTPVPLNRSRWALTKKGRSLRLAHGGHTYTCTATRRGKGYVVAREGVRVRVSPKGRGSRTRQTVEVHGPAEPVDLSIAVVFTGANLANLTVPGAVRSALARLLDLNS